MYFMDANIPLKKNETVFEKLAVTKYVKTEIYFILCVFPGKLALFGRSYSKSILRALSLLSNLMMTGQLSIQI